MIARTKKSTKPPLFDVRNLTISIDEHTVVRDVCLRIHAGELHVLMGPNGSGKSSLLFTLMGYPRYRIVSGSIRLDGRDMRKTAMEDRARQGVFLAFQNPAVIPGVSLTQFIKAAHDGLMHANDAPPIDVKQLFAQIKEQASQLNLDMNLLSRGMNDGFSGGEKKKAEMLQMSVARPRVALIDEIDSGLDLDAVERVTHIIERLRKETRTGILCVTHNPRVADLLSPDRVHIMRNGAIVDSGGAAMLSALEHTGFHYDRNEVAQN